MNEYHINLKNKDVIAVVAESEENAISKFSNRHPDMEKESVTLFESDISGDYVDFLYVDGLGEDEPTYCF